VTDLIDKVTDVHQTLAYSGRKLSRKFLGIGLVALAAGAILIYLQPADFGPFEWFMTALTLAVGGVSTLYGLVRWIRPKTLLVMSPAGLRLHIDFVKDVVIPWHEVRGVDSIDISGRVGGHLVFLPGVTVVLVSRAFYDRHIHVNSWFLRGPGWDTNFIPKDSMVQVALQHEALPASAEELRAAVEARWRAFRDAKPAAALARGTRTPRSRRG
jgi:hypothetical protein